MVMSSAPAPAKPPLVYKGPTKVTTQKPLPPMPHIVQPHEKRVVKPLPPSQPIELIEGGEKSRIRLFQAVVIQNKDDMNALWARHQPGNPAPEVDFEKYTVLAVFDGQKNRVGNQVQITSVRKTDSGANVTYRVNSTGGAKPNAMVAAQPYQIVKTAKVIGSVAFAREQFSQPTGVANGK